MSVDWRSRTLTLANVFTVFSETALLKHDFIIRTPRRLQKNWKRRLRHGCEIVWRSRISANPLTCSWSDSAVLNIMSADQWLGYRSPHLRRGCSGCAPSNNNTHAKASSAQAYTVGDYDDFGVARSHAGSFHGRRHRLVMTIFDSPCEFLCEFMVISHASRQDG